MFLSYSLFCSRFFLLGPRSSLAKTLSYQTTDQDGRQVKRTVKKYFNYEGICRFCQKKGHHISYCPSTPTVVPENKKCKFVEELLSTPKLKLKEYEKFTRDETIQRVIEKGTLFNRDNPWRHDTRPMTGLRIGFWKAIGADKSVLSWIAYGYQIKVALQPQRKLFRNAPNTEEHKEFIDNEIRTHIGDGSFTEIEENEAWVVNPFLIAVNSNGKARRCDDMRYVNAFLPSPFFKMQTLEKDIPNIVRPGDELFTRDLEKAYYKIPIEEQSTRLQCFYCGFCQAPFLFTKIVRVVVRFFGALLIRLMNFVDDFLFTDKAEKITELAQFVDKVLHLLGWVLSMKDNQMGEKVRFLGFIIDTTTRRFSIDPKTRLKTVKMIELVIEKSTRRETITVSEIQSLTGKLTSLKLAIPSIPIWIRDLYFCLPRDEEYPVILSEQALLSLKKVMTLVLDSPSAPFVSPVVERDVYVDSGECGWGASTLGVEVWGTFDSNVIGRSSTYRELQGFLLMLQHTDMILLLRGKTVRFNLDSQCAIANFLHSGPVQTLAP